MLVEDHASSVPYRSKYDPYVRTNFKLFPATEFLVELLQHLPEARSRLARRCALYSTRSRGTWSRTRHLLRLAMMVEQRPFKPKVREAARRGPTDR
jgi:hypothetical protein